MFRLSQQVKATRDRRETGASVHRAGQLRVQKDVNELDIPPSIQVSFPDPDDLMNFQLALSPEEGYYEAGKFDFSVVVPEDYPHKPPKVKCTTPIYHPNIDLCGNLLFLEPNPDDPLNKEAAELLKRDRFEFQRNVSTAIRGGYVAGTLYPSARRR